jgi:hypothetical protein
MCSRVSDGHLASGDSEIHQSEPSTRLQGQDYIKMNTKVIKFWYSRVSFYEIPWPIGHIYEPIKNPNSSEL